MVERVHADELLIERSGAYQDALRRAVLELGIWISPKIYVVRPHLVPFAVRDGSARSKANKEKQELWGTPNAQGFFRDDNSLVKNWVKSLDIEGPNLIYRGRRIGNGFVACHVWRGVEGDQHLHGDPLLNSFVPNLVWLPSELARLSDRTGGYVQRVLQVLARRIYGAVPIPPELTKYVHDSWVRLPSPAEPPEVEDAALHYFAYDAKAMRRQDASLRSVFDGIALVRDGDAPQKVYSKRYGLGLAELDRSTLDALLDFLRPYLGPGGG